MRVTVFSIVAALFAASGAMAQAAPDDVTILQYALTLEHLENRFYSDALAKFSESDYTAAGFPAATRQRVEELSFDEQTHVSFLRAGLRQAGATPTRPCTYDFSAALTDVKTFLAYSRILEGVGVSAYLGAAKDISEDAYLTAAGAILTVEARHSAVVSEVQGEIGYPAPFDTPLGYSNVYTLAAGFIKSCPSSNPTLPVTKFDPLAIYPNEELKSGQQVRIKFDKKGKRGPFYVWVLNGLDATPVKIMGAKNMVFRVPKTQPTGRLYLVVSTSNTELLDSNTVAGPAFADLPPLSTQDSLFA